MKTKHKTPRLKLIKKKSSQNTALKTKNVKINPIGNIGIPGRVGSRPSNRYIHRVAQNWYKGTKMCMIRNAEILFNDRK